MRVRSLGRSIGAGEEGADMLIELMAIAAVADTCRSDAATNRRIVEDFYRLALIEKRPKPAFERFMSPDFVEHKPDIASGDRDGAAAFLGEVIAEVPTARWEVLRVIAEGDMVALHARFTPAPSAPAYAIADFFRVKDCKIVEHWDVVAGPVKDARNPRSRF